MKKILQTIHLFIVKTNFEIAIKILKVGYFYSNKKQNQD